MRARIAQVLHREGDTLRAGNLLLRAHLLSKKAQDQLARERDDQAGMSSKSSNGSRPATVFANPFPALELIANGAVQFQMISELASVYGIQVTTSHVRMIGGQMIQMMLKLGLVETATSLVAGLFKSTLVGYAAAGAVQGVSMAYLTHISGEAFVEYFRARSDLGRRRHAGRPDPPVRPRPAVPTSSRNSPNRRFRKFLIGSCNEIDKCEQPPVKN